jgi:hypothetical protein
MIPQRIAFLWDATRGPRRHYHNGLTQETGRFHNGGMSANLIEVLSCPGNH